MSATDVAGNLLAVASTLLVGQLLRARRDQNALLAQRNRELEQLREAQTRSAIIDERMRIAREVHDVVGHSLVAITDDGTSAAPAAREGSGLRGMRERAEQLGGSLDAGPAPVQGWRVRARFPVERVTA